MEKYDIAISIGPECRPAYHLQKLEFRKSACPLDWIISPLNSTLELYKSGFNDFFKEYEDLKNSTRYGYRRVKDTKYDLVSIHHIKTKTPLNESVTDFRNMMLRRYKRLDENLKNKKSILLLGNHNKEWNELADFLKEFAKIYPNKKITFVNIHSRKNGRGKHTKKIDDNLTIVQYYFDDDKRCWKGNEKMWTSVLNEYGLNE